MDYLALAFLALFLGIWGAINTDRNKVLVLSLSPIESREATLGYRQGLKGRAGRRHRRKSQSDRIGLPFIHESPRNISIASHSSRIRLALFATFPISSCNPC